MADNTRAESSRSIKAFGIRNLHDGLPEVRALHSDNYSLEMQRSDTNVGFVMEGAKIVKILNRTTDGIVTEQPLALL